MSTETLGQFAFYSLAALVLLPAVFVVTTRNLVHAGFWLLPTLIGVAGLYALLQAHLFVPVQVLIYVGAILVLILFALMLTRDVMDPRERQTNGLVGWAALICGTGAFVAGHVLFRHAWPSPALKPDGPHAQAAALGAALIGRYALIFEAASVILLAALVVAIVIAKAPPSHAQPKPCGETDP